MIVQPRDRRPVSPDDDLIELVPAGDGMIVACDVISPASHTGRTVYLHVPAHQMAPVLRAVRRQGARDRSAPLPP